MNTTRDAARWAFEERGEPLTEDETRALYAELDDARKVAATNEANWADARRRLQDVTDQLAEVHRRTKP